MSEGHRIELIRYGIGAVHSVTLTAVACWAVMGTQSPVPLPPG